jgi:hypothetical protein
MEHKGLEREREARLAEGGRRMSKDNFWKEVYNLLTFPLDFGF